MIPPFTLLISSCDTYRDAWDPLFTLFRRYWPDVMQMPIVLNTETSIYEHEGFNIVNPQLYCRNSNPTMIPWSRRLRDTIHATVKTDLVLLYLDDFYLRSPVNTSRLNYCVEFMKNYPQAANVALFTCPPPYVPTLEHSWMVKRSKNSPYLFNLQAGLWRTERLLHFLRDHESPWYFERWGSLRGRRYPDDFYATVAIDGKEAIFDYWPSMQGLSKGLWLPKTPDLFKVEAIDLDLTIRGVMPLGWRAPRSPRKWCKSALSIFRSLCP
jgi:hypothetical protein